LISVVGALLALTGCATKTVDVGDETPVLTGASLSDYQGSWEGYVEAFEWPDSSDKIRVMLDAEGNGVLEVGEPLSGPPPEVDPDSGPPNFPNNGYPFGGATQALMPGFSFPIAGAVVQSSRIRFGTILGEPYREWCELQTPYLDELNTDEGPRYGCLPNTGYESTGDGNNICFSTEDPEHTMPFDCNKLACQHTCACDAEGCTLANNVAQMVFDAELEAEGEELDGSLVHNGIIYNVNMTRAD
jgi:hypothetical protein